MDTLYAVHRGDRRDFAVEMDTDGDGVMVARVLIYAFVGIAVFLLA